MNEKDLKILEQYELQVKNIYRGRGAYLCETEKGLFLLKEYQSSVQKAEFIQKICLLIKENTGKGTDYFLKNKEGALLTMSKEEVSYVLKAWTTGKECGVNSMEEIEKAVQNLGELHKAISSLKVPEIMNASELNEIYFKHIKELKKIRTFIRDKKKKTSFELFFLEHYDDFVREAEESMKFLQNGASREVLHSARENGSICHGDYNQHNVFIEPDGVFTANFDQCFCGSQMEDLYHFMRKILEKHNWNLELAKRMLHAYDLEKALLKDELKDLYVRFYFPEKFWKVANHYYNSRKSWISERSTEKLETLVAQKEEKNKFLYYLSQNS